MQNKVGIKRIAKLTLNALAWITFVLSFSFAIILFIANVNDPSNDKTAFGVKFYSVTSGSMSLSDRSVGEPIFFDAGDVIFAREREDYTDLSVGEVITFVSESEDSLGLTVTHKIVAVKRNSVGDLLGYVTAGINTGVPDEGLVRTVNIQGVYAGKIPDLGWVVEFSKEPASYFTCILFPFVLIIIYLSVQVGYLSSSRRFSAPPSPTPNERTGRSRVIKLKHKREHSSFSTRFIIKRIK